MLLSKGDIRGNSEQRLKFIVKASQILPTWEFYGGSYSYTLEKIFEAGLRKTYDFNYRARSILFLVRHYFELCLKLNLSRYDDPLQTHSFSDLNKQFPVGTIPEEFITCTELLNHTEDGAAYRYLADKITKGTIFRPGNTVRLFDVLRIYNSIRVDSGFKVNTICPIFDYNDRRTQWALTFHVGEAYSLGQIRTQYDHNIEFMIQGIAQGNLEVHRVFLPLMFLIRHSIELALKENIIEIQHAHPSLIKDENVENEHSLVRLFNIYNRFLDNLNLDHLGTEIQQELEGYRTNFERLSQSLHILDSNSRYFRYPVDGRGKLHELRFDKNILNDILDLYYLTDPFITFNNYVLDDHKIINLNI